MFLRLIFAMALFCAWPALAADAPKDKAIAESDLDALPPEPNTILLQGLNKVTGHILKLEGPIGTVLRFGNLEIIARRCWKSPPDESPENAALLEISELKPGEAPQKIFLGWMFSSSPGLSGLEHPVYDITVIGCEAKDNPEGEPEKSEKSEKAEKPAKPEKK